jgi:hypothetical protein
MSTGEYVSEGGDIIYPGDEAYISPRNERDVIERLNVLWRKLEDEGRYVGASTAWDALIEIKRLRKGL